MAAAKTYSAVFAIGARLQGSFNATMAAAQRRLHKIESAAAAVGSRFKAMAFGALAGFGGAIAGFGIEKVFGSIFGDMSQEAAQAEQRARQLSIVLLQHEAIRKRGIGFAHQLTHAIFENNEALAKQGVISAEALDAASAQLAIFGYAPKKIESITAAMQDVLVTFRGVNATSEEAAGLADAWGRAVKTGMTKPMRQYGFILSDTQAKEFRGLKNARLRNEWITKWAKGFKDVAAAAALTPEGKIARFHNEVKAFARDIGREVLPVQAEMAEGWLKALPQTKPAIIGSIRAVGRMAKWAGVQVADLFAVLNPPQEQQQGVQLFTSYKDMLGRFNATTGQKDSSFNAVTSPMNDWSRSGYVELISALDKVRESINGLGPAFDQSKKDSSSWGDWLGHVINDFGIKTSIMLKSDAQDIAGLGLAWQALQADPSVAIITANWNKSWSDLWANLKTIHDWMAINLTDQKLLTDVTALFKGMGQAVRDWFLAPLDDVKKAWEYIKNLSASPPSAPAGAAPPVDHKAFGAFEGMATGGVVRNHSVMQLAERGPEAVIPLRRDQRSEGLLNYASRKIGAGGTLNHSSQITFAPNVTVNGSATESDRTAMKETLRSLADDFIAKLNAAQRQARRLSFESSYA